MVLIFCSACTSPIASSAVPLLAGSVAMTRNVDAALGYEFGFDVRIVFLDLGVGRAG